MQITLGPNVCEPKTFPGYSPNLNFEYSNWKTEKTEKKIGNCIVFAYPMSPKSKGLPAAPTVGVKDLFTSLNRHIQRSEYEQGVKVSDQSQFIFTCITHFSLLHYAVSEKWTYDAFCHLKISSILRESHKDIFKILFFFYMYVCLIV